MIPIPSLSSDLKIFCFGLGIPFSIVFLTVYLANRSRYILIDDEKIVCSRGATVITQNGEQQRKFDRTTLAYNDICNVKRDIIKGVKLLLMIHCFIVLSYQTVKR